MQYWHARDHRERSEGVKQRARLVVEWAMNQAFRAAALKARKGLHQLGLSTAPLSPRVIEILEDEVCMHITPVTPFTVHCILFLLSHTKMLLTTSHLHRIR